MQQIQTDIPTLGGLPEPTRVQRLREEGARAQQAVQALLQRARSRARILAAVRAGALLLAGLLLALLGGALLASVASAGASRAAFLLLALGAVAGVVLFSRRSPLQRAAVHARDPRLLARLLTGASDLLSSVELSSAEPSGASADLLLLLHIRAAESARTLDLDRALPLRSLRLPFAALALASLALLSASVLAPRRLSQGLSRLARGDAKGPLVELSPIVGDLSITYLYPAYTGLPPRVEEGTAGDLHAPRGTEVRISARADRDLDQALAVVNGAAVKLDAQGAGHRLLSGTFTLTKAGQWSLRFADPRGRTLAEGPPRPIEIVADAAPQVTIEAPVQRMLEVDPQGRVPITWSATDDYGLSQVTLVTLKAGGKEERLSLQSPQGAARRLRGSYGWELAGLSLRPGDKVSYYIEAKDNDAVDGPQRGVSATQSIKVFSAAEHSREALVKAQALWERLVLLLADRLEEKPAPDEAAAAAAWYAQTGSKDKDARQLSAELDAAARELIKDKQKDLRPLGRALRYTASSLGPAVQRTSVGRAPLSRGVAGHDGSLRLFGLALQAEIHEEEKDVLYLEDLLDKARLDAMQELGKELAASRRELARLAEKLRSAPDEATKKELLAEVERLRERIQDLMQRMSELAKGVQDEHLNQEAMQSAQKEQDLLGQLSDIQKKLQSGNVEEALKQLDKLGQQLDKLEKDLQQKASDQQGGQYAEEAKKLQQAASALKEIREKEQDLQKRTAQLQRELRAQDQKRFEEKGGKSLTKKLQEKVAQARKAIKEIDPTIAEHLGLEDALEMAQSRVDDLARALQLGDFNEALDLAERGLRATEMLQGRLAMEDQVAQRYPGFAHDAGATRKALAGAAQAQPPLQDVVNELQDALPREGQGLTPEQQKRLQKQGQEQAQLKDQLGKAREQLDEVGKKAPIFGPQHKQMLEQAQQGMGQAEQKLGRGEPRGAQAGEEQSLEKLQQFEDAMQQLAKQGGSSKGQGGIPMPWGEPQGEGDEQGDDGESQSTKHDKVEIPDAEAGRGPIEFRKKLLDAMKQAPPEKFKDRVKQYYEELVK
jgi:hypothetical protein